MSNIRAIVAETRMQGVEGLWYLATPYAKYPFGRETAVRHAAMIAAELIKMGVAIFSPIAHSHNISMLGAIPPDAHDIWLPLDEKVMRGCAGMIVARMPGYHYSVGVSHEIAWMNNAKKPVLYLDVAELIGLPPIFSDQLISKDAETKIMNEPQPTVAETLAAHGESMSEADTEKVLAELAADTHPARDTFAYLYGGGLGPVVVGLDLAEPGSDKTGYSEFDPATGETRVWSQAEVEAHIANNQTDADRAELDRLGIPHSIYYGEVAQADPDPREGHAYRKERPVAGGVLAYFPLAIAEVARISALGTLQHHPDGDLHWDRDKSNDHADALVRHLMDAGLFSEDGARHSGNMAWRALALLQEELENELLGRGVHASTVFSPASRFSGRPAKDYFSIEGAGASNRREWLARAAEFWGPADDVGGVDDDSTCEQDTAMWNAANARNALDKRPFVVSKDDPMFQAGYDAAMNDVKLEGLEDRPSDGRIYREMSRAQFSPESNAEFDAELRRRIAETQQDIRDACGDDVARWKTTAPSPDAQEFAYKQGFGPGDGEAALEQVNTAESVQDHAARSLHSMVVEWYRGGTTDISLANIKRRLKRFWHD